MATLTVAALELIRASGPLLDHAFATGVVTAGITAVATYAGAGLVAALLVLATGARTGNPGGRTVLAGAVVAAVLRLVLQGLDGEALYWTGLVAVAWVVGVLVLAVAFVAGRAGGPRQAALGLVLGCALSVGLQLVLGTWDALWRSSWVGWLVAALIALAPLISVRVANPAWGAGAPPTCRPRRLWAVGPFLALAAMMLANPAFVASQSGVALGWAGLALAAGAIVGGWLLVRPDRWSSLVRVCVAVLVVAGVAVAIGVSGPAALVAVVVLVAVVGIALVGVLSVRRPAPLGWWRPAGAAALVGLGVVGPLLLYMLDYDVPLPVDNAIVPVLAALTVAITSLHHRAPTPPEGATDPDGRQPARVRATRFLLAPVGVLALVGFAMSTTSATGADVPAASRGDDLTVMTWNLHYGVAPGVGVDLDEIAATIEAADPDVVLLQEVERGWVFGGGTDMATWLAARLDMTFEFAPAADHQFGNAVLARSGLTEVAVHPLPYGAGPQSRSALSATITTASGDTARVTSVHLQHREENTPTRLDQLETLLADEPVTGPSVLGGDLNAEPGWPEIQLLEGAGWVSAVDAVGDPDALTSPADEPAYRIDWIFGQQVTFTDAHVVTGVQASDHLPVLTHLTLP
ncbi:hypothetical protein CCO02nite_23160 [Cellulomonas composti]|uniref:Endonuclease/exonuclease/phosphatase domain-containing protein n=1 Tax=Cellulomonas composti TaxID=266130 RepID=A0A511JCD6_9CELL|nr:hypothetical protein CCO02nite_23160 [Cellulomonas composti]